MNANVETPAKPDRLLSLDVLRGFTIFIMLLVNNVALDTATPSILTHAPWNAGLRLADLVFPWFLFCVGAAIPFSRFSALKKNLPPWRYELRIISRTVLIFLLGLLVDSSIAGRPIFALGVLQLIALAYLVGAFLYDLPISRRILIIAGLLAGYWAAIKFIPIPGSVAGVFEENLNLIRHLNLTYLARFNLSGLFSVIPTGAMVLIGTIIGDILRVKEKDHLWKIAWIVLGGAGLVVIGLLWNQHLPFNKPLWTPSYILFTSGLAVLILALLYLIIDANGWRRWAFPFLVFGSNAILVYVAPILVKVLILQRWQMVGQGGQNISVQQWLLDLAINLGGRIAGGWAYTIAYILIWWFVLWLLYRKRIFFRV